MNCAATRHMTAAAVALRRGLVDVGAGPEGGGGAVDGFGFLEDGRQMGTHRGEADVQRFADVFLSVAPLATIISTSRCRAESCTLPAGRMGR